MFLNLKEDKSGHLPLKLPLPHIVATIRDFEFRMYIHIAQKAALVGWRLALALPTLMLIFLFRYALDPRSR